MAHERRLQRDKKGEKRKKKKKKKRRKNHLGCSRVPGQLDLVELVPTFAPDVLRLFLQPRRCRRRPVRLALRFFFSAFLCSPVVREAPALEMDDVRWRVAVTLSRSIPAKTFAKKKPTLITSSATWECPLPSWCEHVARSVLAHYVSVHDALQMQSRSGWQP